MTDSKRLRQYNRWRRGDNRMMQPDPKALGELLDRVAEALDHAEEMRIALQVIHTWAGVPGALDARHVRDLTSKALHMGARAPSVETV